MVNMYEIIKFLCDSNEISIAKMCNDIGLRQGLISDLKHGRSKTLSAVNMQKIANYFNVSTDIFNEGVFEETLPNNADMKMLQDIQLKFSLKKKNAPTLEGERKVSDEDIKFALFGGSGDITDAMMDEVRSFAAYVKQREEQKKKKE